VCVLWIRNARGRGKVPFRRRRSGPGGPLQTWRSAPHRTGGFG